MRKRYKSAIIATAMTGALLLVGSQAMGHPTVKLRDANGAVINDHTTPYSPRTTCGACHDQSTAQVGTGENGWAPGSYAGGGTTKTVVKTQGVLDASTDAIGWVSFESTAYEHGFVVGRHSQQGRNEDYGQHLRHAVHGKFWANSPGMFGKY